MPRISSDRAHLPSSGVHRLAGPQDARRCVLRYSARCLRESNRRCAIVDLVPRALRPAPPHSPASVRSPPRRAGNPTVAHRARPRRPALRYGSRQESAPRLIHHVLRETRQSRRWPRPPTSKRNTPQPKRQWQRTLSKLSGESWCATWRYDETFGSIQAMAKQKSALATDRSLSEHPCAEVWFDAITTGLPLNLGRAAVRVEPKSVMSS